MLVRKRFAAVVAALAVVLAPCFWAGEASAEHEKTVHSGESEYAPLPRLAPNLAIAFDLVVLRPAGFARFVLGSVITTLVIPFTLISGQTEEVVQQLVTEPGKYTFQRKLGDF